MASKIPTPTELALPELRLTDVYSIAENVGEQFHQLIKQFGSTYLSNVVPIVFNALLHLERCVEENQRLEISCKKLMLQVDSLAHEREQRILLSNKVDELQTKLEAEIEDKNRLLKKIERFQMRNDDLSKQLDHLKGTSLKSVPIGQDPLNAFISDEQKSPSVSSTASDISMEFCSARLPVDTNAPDVLEHTRMSKRYSQVEVELQKTRRKLAEAHHGWHSVAAENRALKAQLDKSRAEAALQCLENSRSGSDSTGECKASRPKFYKEDLLAVLREKNELKEELDTVSEDLDMARDEIKRLEALSQRRSSTASLPGLLRGRTRATTRVREILDSITESLHPEPPETM